jgi:hypothetical protein
MRSVGGMLGKGHDRDEIGEAGRVELARGATADAGLAEAIRERLRNVLVVQTRVDLVPWGSLRRSEYKSKLEER